MADVEQKMQELSRDETWKKHILTKTTNGTYGQFYQFRKLLGPPEEEKPDWHTHNHEYGKFDHTPTAGFIPTGQKSPELRYGLGYEGKEGNEKEQTANQESKGSSPEQEDNVQQEVDDRMLTLPPVDENSLPKAGQHARLWVHQEPLPTPGTWWSKESPRLQRPNPPTSGYAKRFMENECSRMWDNMEVIAGRGIQDRLGNYKPDVLEVSGDQTNDSPGCGQEEANTYNQESYEDILAKYNIK